SRRGMRIQCGQSPSGERREARSARRPPPGPLPPSLRPSRLYALVATDLDQPADLQLRVRPRPVIGAVSRAFAVPREPPYAGGDERKTASADPLGHVAPAHAVARARSKRQNGKADHRQGQQNEKGPYDAVERRTHAAMMPAPRS